MIPMKTKDTLWIVGGLVVLAGGLIGYSRLPQLDLVPPEQMVLLTPLADDHTKGAVGSRVVLMEYLDFECEACGAYFPLVKQLEQEYGDRVTFVVRYFPLPGHRNALPAAYAAEAADHQGKFWEMHDLLFTRQKEWGEKQAMTPEVFEGYAKELGMNMDKFKADVASLEVAARVKRDMNSGNELGVRSTPTFFLNGIEIHPRSYEEFRALLDEALQ